MTRRSNEKDRGSQDLSRLSGSNGSGVASTKCILLASMLLTQCGDSDLFEGRSKFSQANDTVWISESEYWWISHAPINNVNQSLIYAAAIEFYGYSLHGYCYFSNDELYFGTNGLDNSLYKPLINYNFNDARIGEFKCDTLWTDIRLSDFAPITSTMILTIQRRKGIVGFCYYNPIDDTRTYCSGVINICAPDSSHADVEL